MTETARGGWLVEGPRNILWILKHLRSLGMTPLMWHRFWRQMLKLQATDPGVLEHEGFCRALEAAVCYDQKVVGESAAWEILGRRFQLHEEKYRLRFLDAERGAGKQSGLDVDEANIFM